MATLSEIKELALHAARGTAPATFSSENVNAALSDALKDLASTYNQFMKNRYDIYEIFIETADEIVPNKVIDAVGIFADVQVVGQGQKAIFKRRIGKNRAKKFLTQVGLSGVYETFRLDTETFSVPAYAVGGAVTIDYERMLDGAEDMAEVMQILTDGLTDSVFLEVQKALRAAINATGRPSVNKYTGSSFNGEEMLKLVNVVRAYGTGAVIFAPPEFIAEMGADAIVPVGSNYQGVYHPQDIDMIHNQGYINIFRGTPIVMIPQSFIDENNEKTWIDPQLAYILPTGGEKVVKVVLEGQTQINDFKNRDNSMEIHVYRKMGAAILTHYNWAIYQNTGIDQTYESPYGI
nr:MAG TPA: major capsid protein [Caudoviricetes sp.]